MRLDYSQYLGKNLAAIRRLWYGSPPRALGKLCWHREVGFTENSERFNFLFRCCYFIVINDCSEKTSRVDTIRGQKNTIPSDPG